MHSIRFRCSIDLCQNIYAKKNIPKKFIPSGPPVRTYRTNSGAYRKARVSSIKRANQGRVKNSRIDPIPGDQSTTGENPNPPANQIQPPILVSQSDQPTKIDDNNNNNTEKVRFCKHLWCVVNKFFPSFLMGKISFFIVVTPFMSYPDLKRVKYHQMSSIHVKAYLQTEELCLKFCQKHIFRVDFGALLL